MQYEITLNGTKVNRLFNSLEELNKGVENLLSMAFRENAAFQPDKVTLSIVPIAE